MYFGAPTVRLLFVVSILNSVMNSSYLMASLWQRVTTPFRNYRPGDRITRFTMFDPAHIYDLSDSNGIIPEVDKTTPINVIGPVSTPFTPGEAKKMIAWMAEEEDVRE